MNIKAKTVWEHWFGGAVRAYDVCGAEMDKAAYGDKKSEFGWEIDHIIPKSRGGKSHIHNLRPLHWENNDAKGDLFDGQWTVARTRSA